MKKIFTLVELLVVISIIIMLAALLLPSLQKVRERGKSIQCLSNERQLSIAFMSYISDNAEYFPIHIGDSGPGTKPNWVGRFLINGYVSHPSIFLCPTHNNLHTQDIKTKTVDVLINSSCIGYLDYGYNFNHIGTSRRYGGAWVPSAKITQLKSPASTLIIADDYNAADQRQGLAYLYDYFFTTFSDAGFADARHSGTINIMWADGHVKSEKINSVTGAGPYTVAANPYMEGILANGTTADSYFGRH